MQPSISYSLRVFGIMTESQLIPQIDREFFYLARL